MYSEKARELIKSANRDVSIDFVTNLLIEQGLLGKTNAKDKFLCPYHPEKTGSFIKFKNGCKCFGCEVYATTTKLYADTHLKKRIREMSEANPNMTMEEQEEFYEKRKHLELWRAAALLSYKSNLISKDEYYTHMDWMEECENSGDIPELYRTSSKGDFNSGYDYDYDKDTTYVTTINNLSDVGDKVLSNYDYSLIASRKELNAIYSLLRTCTIEVRGNALLDHHREHLNKVRFLSDEYIDFYRYFSLPTKEEKYPVMKKIISKMNRFGYNLDSLKVSPGFSYFEEKGYFTIAGGTKCDAISIPMEDMFSNIKRIQLRPDEGTKTAWFATPGAGNCKAPSTIRYPFNKSYTDFAKGNLRPFDIIYTQVDEETICTPCENDIGLMFTEGDYKAVHLSNALNSPALSTQGLTPWYNMFVEYTRIKDYLLKFKLKVTKGFIVFDCDTKFKRGLADKGKGVHRVLKSEGIDAYYITWDYKYGKGVDDVINSGHTDKLRIVDAEVYEQKYDLIIDILAMEHKKLKQYLEEDDIKPYYEKLEKFSVKKLQDIKDRMILTNKFIIYSTNRKVSELKKSEINDLINVANDKTLDELRELTKGV